MSHALSGATPQSRLSGFVQPKHFISVVALTLFILMFWTLDQEAPEAGSSLSLWVGREEESDSNGEEERQNPASPGEV